MSYFLTCISDLCSDFNKTASGKPWDGKGAETDPRVLKHLADSWKTLDEAKNLKEKTKDLRRHIEEAQTSGTSYSASSTRKDVEEYQKRVSDQIESGKSNIESSRKALEELEKEYSSAKSDHERALLNKKKQQIENALPSSSQKPKPFRAAAALGGAAAGFGGGALAGAAGVAGVAGAGLLAKKILDKRRREKEERERGGRPKIAHDQDEGYQKAAKLAGVASEIDLAELFGVKRR